MGQQGDSIPDSIPSGADLVAFAPEEAQKLIRLHNKLTNLGVTGDLTLDSTNDFLAIGYSTPVQSTPYTCAVTGNWTTGGEYTGWILSGSLGSNITGGNAASFTTGNVSGGNVTGSDFGNAVGKCIIVNAGEAGSAGWLLGNGTTIPNARLLSYTTDGNKTPILACNIAPSAALIPVTLTKDGGSTGNATTAPSFTYTLVSNAITGANITGPGTITGLVPVNRPTWGNVTAATAGEAFIGASGNWTLWHVYEWPVGVTSNCGNGSGNGG